MAKLKIGGGAKLEAELRRISEGCKRGGILRVGFLSGATYPDKPKAAIKAAYGAKKAKGDQSPVAGSTAGNTMNVASVAFFQEYGTGTIPARPFFRNMIKEKGKEWGGAIATALVKSDYDGKQALDVVGAGIAGQLRESIINTNSPALAESTIRRKQSAKALVETGHMLASVDHEVKDRS